MHTVIQLFFTTVLSVIGGISGAEDAAQQTVANDEGASVEIVNADAVQQARVADALQRFADAGLALPQLTIEFAPDGDATLCKGNAGLFRHGDADERDHISICGRMRLTLLHELAHAHIKIAVGEQARNDFLDHWGTTDWNDQSASWSERGNERAANSIAYTLTVADTPANEVVNDLVCSYALLTGATHINVAHADCDPEIA